jgi:AcrR family transcriptional regulator
MTEKSQAAVREHRSQNPVRRRLRPEDRRTELLDAAIRVLRDLGPEACRIEDITEAAGTAKGNLYRHFATWDELMVAVRDHVLDCYRTELLQRYSDPSSVDWWVALDYEIERFVDFQLGLGGLHEAIFHGLAASAHPRETHRSASFMIAVFLAAGIEHGAFAPVDVEVIAPLLFQVLHGAADAVASGTDRERVLDATLQIVHRTLEPPQ